MTLSGASLNSLNDLKDQRQSFRVPKPTSNSSREIRDAILRLYFGYTEADLGELTRVRDNLFYVRRPICMKKAKESKKRSEHTKNY